MLKPHTSTEHMCPDCGASCIIADEDMGTEDAPKAVPMVTCSSGGCGYTEQLSEREDAVDDD